LWTYSWLIIPQQPSKFNGSNFCRKFHHGKHCNKSIKQVNDQLLLPLTSSLIFFTQFPIRSRWRYRNRLCPRHRLFASKLRRDRLHLVLSPNGSRPPYPDFPPGNDHQEPTSRCEKLEILELYYTSRPTRQCPHSLRRIRILEYNGGEGG